MTATGMTDSHYVDLVERLARLDGKLDTLTLAIEAGDNATRQLLKFTDERVERVASETATQVSAMRAHIAALEAANHSRRESDAAETARRKTRAAWSAFGLGIASSVLAAVTTALMIG